MCGPGVRRVNRGKTRCDPDVGDDDLQVLCRHHFPHHLLHFFHELVRVFNPGAGGCLEIDDKLAGVGARKIGFADQRIESEAQDENAGDAEHGDDRTEQRQIEPAFVTVEHLPELAVEPVVESRAPALGFGRLVLPLRLVAFDQLRAEQRHDGHGHEVGSEKREDNTQGQRRKEIRLTPYRKITGKNTTAVARVDANTGWDASWPPLSAATMGGSPAPNGRRCSQEQRPSCKSIVKRPAPIRRASWH